MDFSGTPCTLHGVHWESTRSPLILVGDCKVHIKDVNGELMVIFTGQYVVAVSNHVELKCEISPMTILQYLLQVRE